MIMDNSSAFAASTTSFENNIVFAWIDYTLFSLMLLFSALIGVYFGFFSKQDTQADYLMGGKNMGVGPISVSLIASYLSGITILGVPSEMYMYGTSYSMGGATLLISIIITSYVFLPVFFTLQMYSCFEYLQLRFDKSIRTFCSFLYVISGIVNIPVVIYIPALAFSQVTGVNIHWITPIVCIICIFYTTLGGLRAVVWTDTLQGIITLISMIIIVVLGLQTLGSPLYVWETASEGSRIDFFNMDPNLTTRSSFITIAFGLSVAQIGFIGINQGFIQKFLSLPTITHARRSLYLFAFGAASIVYVSCFTGLMMYAHYKGCDPYTTEKVKRPDQLLVYYVMDIGNSIPGLPGLFVAGVFSAALSTMSAGMNTMSGTIYEDFVAPLLSKDTSEKRASNFMKLIVIIIGIVCVILVFVVENLGAVLQLTISLSGITLGPMLGLFFLGILFPWSNTKGALVGGIAGLSFLAFIVIGAQVNIAQGNITFPPLPLSTELCPVDNTTATKTLNITVFHSINKQAEDNDEAFVLFRISFYLYALVGLLTVLFFGLITSWITGWQDLNKLNPDLISPIMHRFLPEKIKMKRSEEYSAVNQSLK